MGVGSLVTVAVGGGVPDLAEDDDPGRAAVDAQRTASADVVVDQKDHVVAGIDAGELGTLGLGDGRRLHHVDALPRADVHAALAHDALGLIDVDELLWLDGLGQIVGVDLNEGVVDAELRHRGIGIDLRHIRP